MILNQLVEVIILNIGNKIREYRLLKGMTISDLAGDEYTKSHISKIENNKSKPSYETIYKLSLKLGVQMEDFFSEVDREWTKCFIEKVDASLDRLKIPNDLFESMYLNINKLTLTKDSVRVLYLMKNHYSLLKDENKSRVTQNKIDDIIRYINDEKVTLESYILSGNIYFSKKEYTEAFNFYNTLGFNYYDEFKKYPEVNQLYLLQYLVAAINIGKEQIFDSIYKNLYKESLKVESFKYFTRATIILLSYYKLSSNYSMIKKYEAELVNILSWIPKVEYQIETILSIGTEPYRNQTLRNKVRYEQVIKLLEEESVDIYINFLKLEKEFINKNYEIVINSFHEHTLPKNYLYCVVDRVSIFQRSLILPLSYIALGKNREARAAFNTLLGDIKDIKKHPNLRELLKEISKLYDL